MVKMTLAVAFVACVFSQPAPAHYQPGPHNVLHAIALSWCGDSNLLCPDAVDAINVSSCETGGTFSVWASNGQYQGIFQMGSSERARYGDGRDPWSQARAAYRYFVASGRDWSPWECKPWDRRTSWYRFWRGTV